MRRRILPAAVDSALCHGAAPRLSAWLAMQREMFCTIHSIRSILGEL